MVDVELRPVDGLTPSHAAGLRRLSARAAAASHYFSSPAPPSPAFSNGAYRSYAPLANAILSHLRASGVRVLPGLSPREFAMAEAELGVVFPPDLRAVLALGLPDAPGFPDWRSASARPLIRAALRLPLAAVAVFVARQSFWHPAWGARPSDDRIALRHARSALRRAPPLLPLLGRFYLPSLPSLPGNPVLLVDESRGVSVFSPDLASFFHSRSAAEIPTTVPRPPRWVDFWTDVAGEPPGRRRRRSSSFSSSSWSSSSSGELAPPSPEEYVEIRTGRVPNWLGEYLNEIGEVLRGGGWAEAEVREVVEAPPTAGLALAFREEMLLKADLMAESLRRAGWNADEIVEVLGFQFPPEPRRREVILPPVIVRKVGELAAAVSLL